MNIDLKAAAEEFYEFFGLKDPEHVQYKILSARPVETDPFGYAPHKIYYSVLILVQKTRKLKDRIIKSYYIEVLDWKNRDMDTGVLNNGTGIFMTRSLSEAIQKFMQYK